MKFKKSQALFGIKLTKSYLAYRLGNPRLTYVFYSPTTRCNLNCSICDCWLNKPEEYDTATNLSIIDKIAEAGVACISFSGGEPLLRDDLEILARRAKSHGIISTLNTNGVLITPERARRLDGCFEGIAVSIDGFEDTHDEIRGRGNFRNAMDGLSNLKKYAKSARIGVSMTIFQKNIGEVVPLLQDLQDTVDFVSFQPLGPYPLSAHDTPAHEEVQQMVQSLLDFKKQKPSYIFPPKTYIQRMIEYFSHNLKKICDAGELYCFIDWKGNVMPCPMLTSRHIGSILEKGLNEIIQNNWSETLKIRRKCVGCFLTCTNMPSMLYNQPLLNREILSQAVSWVSGRR